MFRGGRGRNRRPYDKPRDGNHRGNRRSGEAGMNNDSKNDKTEWVSYSRPKLSDTKSDETKVSVKNQPQQPPQLNQEVKAEKSNGNASSLQQVPEQDISAIQGDSAVTGLRGKYQGKPGEKKFSGRCRLFVANMNNNTTEDELRQLFNEFGETGELFINKEKGFGFIRMDFRHNAELAKGALDKKVFKGRVIQVRFATHASAIELHGLDDFASNEYIEKAMSQFGNVERAVVVCDDRGRSKGYAIVEFEWKKTAQKVLDRFKEEMFVLGRLPKPVFVKQRSQLDEEEGIHEEEIEKHPATENERTFTPRFISPSSFEYTWSKKWRDLFIEEEDKKAKLDQDIRDARYQLEMEMETALREQEAVKIRDGMIEELNRRQEELRRLEEDMRIRAEMNQRAREIDTGRPKQFDDRRSYSPRQQGPPPPRENLPPPPTPPVRSEGFPENPARQNEIILQQQAELEMRRGELLRTAGIQPNMLGIRPELLQNQNVNLPPSLNGPLGLPPGVNPGLPAPMPSGPRGPPPPGMIPPPIHGGPLPPRPHFPRDGPPPRRDFPPRGGDRFDHKRPRRE